MCAQLSPDVVWFNVRRNNSFAVKRNGTNFTSEKNNLLNKNSFKYSGLANRKTVGLESAEAAVHTNKKGVKEVTPRAVLVIKKKRARRANRPANAYQRVKLNKDFRRVAKTIQQQLVGRHYRPDLVRVALARWTKLYQTVKLTHAIQKKKKAAAPKK